MTAMAKRADTAVKRIPPEKRNIKGILKQLETGRTLAEVAATQGIKKSALSHWLLTTDSEAYQKSKNIIADTIAGEMIKIADEVCTEQTDVARARNRINARQFILKSRFASRYGDKQEVTHHDKSKVQPIINVFLASPDATVAIDGEVIDAKALPCNDKAVE